jgi:carbon storage regulator CsrA
MLVLTARLREKVLFPDLHTSVEVLSLQASGVKLGIEAPEEIRILREGLPDRLVEWGSNEENGPFLEQLDGLVEKRLAIARQGLAEARKYLKAGRTEEAGAILDKLDEDMHLLRCRLRREIEFAAPGN